MTSTGTPGSFQIFTLNSLNSDFRDQSIGSFSFGSTRKKRDRDVDVYDPVTVKRVLDVGISKLSLNHDSSLTNRVTSTQELIDYSDYNHEADVSESRIIPAITSTRGSTTLEDEGMEVTINRDDEIYSDVAPLPLLGHKHTRKVDLLIDNLIRKERRMLELRSMGLLRDGYMLDGADVGVPHSVGPQPTIDQALLSAGRWPVVCRDDHIWTIDTSCSSGSGCASASLGADRSPESPDPHAMEIQPAGRNSRLYYSNDVTHSDWTMEWADGIDTGVTVDDFNVNINSTKSDIDSETHVPDVLSDRVGIPNISRSSSLGSDLMDI